MNEQQPAPGGPEAQTPPPAPQPAPAYGPPPPPREPQASVLDRFFGWLRSIGLTRDTDEKWLAGICAGIARRLGVDPLVVRAGLVVLVLLGGIGITIYLVAWLLIPDRDGTLLIEAALRRGDVVGVLLLALAAVTMFGGPGFIFDDSGFWWVIWIGVPVAVLVWVFSRRDSRGQPVPVQQTATETAARAQQWGEQVGPKAQAWGEQFGQRVTELTQKKDDTPMTSSATTYAAATAPAPTAPATPAAGAQPPAYGPPPPPRKDQPAYGPPPTPRPLKPLRRKGIGFAGFIFAIGLSILAFGAATMLHDSQNWSGDRTLIAMAAALGTLGLVVLVAGLAGRRAGFTGFVAVLVALATWGAAVVPGLNVAGGVGDRTWTPTSSADYDMGFGSATLQLDQVKSGEVDAELGIGELRIEIPEGTTVRVIGETEVGSIDVRSDNYDQFGGTDEVPDLSTDNGDGPNNEGERIDQTFGQGEPDVTVDAQVGIGQITVVTP